MVTQFLLSTLSRARDALNRKKRHNPSPDGYAARLLAFPQFLFAPIVHVALAGRLYEVKMRGEVNGALADRDPFTGRFKRGNDARFARQLKIAAKLEQLRHEYFPCGGESSMDVSRLLPSTM
jgi:hypothetical protein